MAGRTPNADSRRESSFRFARHHGGSRRLSRVPVSEVEEWPRQGNGEREVDGAAQTRSVQEHQDKKGLKKAHPSWTAPPLPRELDLKKKWKRS